MNFASSSPEICILYDPIKYQLLNVLNMLKKRDVNEKSQTSYLSNLNNFHSLDVVYRVSDTQLQVSENSDYRVDSSWRHA